MTCFHPITAYQKNFIPRNLKNNEEELKKWRKLYFHKIPNATKIEIPCGKCIGCRLDHANMWATRITDETKLWKSCCFVTLTYNNGTRNNGKPQLPLAPNGKPTLKMSDVQNFLKRLRKLEHGEIAQQSKDGKMQYPIRYFYCGEYGTKNGRPHYHIAIFNWKPDDLKYYGKSGSGEKIYTSEKLTKIWGHGFAPVGTLTYKSACYIARYVTKKTFETKNYNYVWREIADDKTGELKMKKIRLNADNEPIPEFIRMSTNPGIGKWTWENEKDKIKRNKGIFITTDGHTKLKPIPRYYKKLWDKENPNELDIFKYQCQKMALTQQAEKLKKYNYAEKYAKKDIINKNDEINLLQKNQKLKRNL